MNTLSERDPSLLPSQEAPFSEQRASDILHGILRSVIHCNARGFLHRDIKPDNFLFVGDPNKAGALLKVTHFL